MRIGTPTLTNKRSPSKRLVMGFAAVASAAVVGVAGMASANANKPSPEKCQQAGYTSYNKCIDDWKNGGGHSGQTPTPVGYGNGNNNTVNTDININVENNGDNNTNNFQVILNYVFG